MPTIQDVIRTRNSVKCRKSTLRKIRFNRRDRYDPEYHDSMDSPLMACGSVFAENVNRIEREYDEMLQRIENATVNL